MSMNRRPSSPPLCVVRAAALAVAWALLALGFLARNAEAAVSERTYSPLFALQIDELVEIHVTGEDSERSLFGEITITSIADFERYSRVVQQLQTPDPQHTLLAIDGEIVAVADIEEDVRRFVSSFDPDANLIEIYTGSSATWWEWYDDKPARQVINIVTKGRAELPAAPNNQEVMP